jgi:pilus assembly protein CpaF
VAAEGAGAALSRLESLARLGAWDASPRALRELCAQAVHIIVQLTRWADGTRRVTSIAEVTGMDNDGPAVRELFRYQAQAGKFAGAGVVPRFYEQLLARGHKADPALFR